MTEPEEPPIQLKKKEKQTLKRELFLQSAHHPKHPATCIEDRYQDLNRHKRLTPSPMLGG